MIFGFLVFLPQAANNYTFEEIQVGLANVPSGGDPVAWLDNNWMKLIETVQTLATKYGQEHKENRTGTISTREAREALTKHKASVWHAVTECIERRQISFNQIQASGNYSSEDIVTYMTQFQGNVDGAMNELNRLQLKPFLMQVLNPENGATGEHAPSAAQPMKSTEEESKSHADEDHTYMLRDIEKIIDNLEAKQSKQTGAILQTIENLFENISLTQRSRSLSRAESLSADAFERISVKSPIPVASTQCDVLSNDNVENHVKQFMTNHIQDILPDIAVKVSAELTSSAPLPLNEMRDQNMSIEDFGGSIIELILEEPSERANSDDSERTSGMNSLQSRNQSNESISKTMSLSPTPSTSSAFSRVSSRCYGPRFSINRGFARGSCGRNSDRKRIRELERQLRLQRKLSAERQFLTRPESQMTGFISDSTIVGDDREQESPQMAEVVEHEERTFSLVINEPENFETQEADLPAQRDPKNRNLSEMVRDTKQLIQQMKNEIDEDIAMSDIGGDEDEETEYFENGLSYYDEYDKDDDDDEDNRSGTLDENEFDSSDGWTDIDEDEDEGEGDEEGEEMNENEYDRITSRSYDSRRSSISSEHFVEAEEELKFLPQTVEELVQVEVNGGESSTENQIEEQNDSDLLHDKGITNIDQIQEELLKDAPRHDSDEFMETALSIQRSLHASVISLNVREVTKDQSVELVQVTSEDENPEENQIEVSDVKEIVEESIQSAKITANEVNSVEEHQLAVIENILTENTRNTPEIDEAEMEATVHEITANSEQSVFTSESNDSGITAEEAENETHPHLPMTHEMEDEVEVAEERGEIVDEEEEEEEESSEQESNEESEPEVVQSKAEKSEQHSSNSAEQAAQSTADEDEQTTEASNLTEDENELSVDVSEEIEIVDIEETDEKVHIEASEQPDSNTPDSAVVVEQANQTAEATTNEPIDDSNTVVSDSASERSKTPSEVLVESYNYKKITVPVISDCCQTSINVLQLKSEPNATSKNKIPVRRPSFTLASSSIRQLQNELLSKQSTMPSPKPVGRKPSKIVPPKLFFKEGVAKTSIASSPSSSSPKPSTSKAVKEKSKKKYYETCFSDDYQTSDDEMPMTVGRKISNLVQIEENNEESNDPEVIALRLLEDGSVSNHEDAVLVTELIQMKFDRKTALSVVGQCSDIGHAISFLQQECELCTEIFSMNKIVSMLKCTHKCCVDCARNYFTIQVRCLDGFSLRFSLEKYLLFFRIFQISDRSISDCTCPFCKEPDLNGIEITEDDVLEYFSNLDILLKNILDESVHELFQRKLRDRTLMQDPNFKWCVQCSSGFFARPRQKRLICPDCGSVTCAQCRKLVKRVDCFHFNFGFDRFWFDFSGKNHTTV